MQNTTFRTISVNIIGSKDPSTIAVAPVKIPLRCLVRNIGATTLFFGTAVQDVAPTPDTATYRVFSGDSEVFILAPQQTLYAIAAGANGSVSVSNSEALPLAGGQ